MKKQNLKYMKSLSMVMLLFTAIGITSVTAQAKSIDNSDSKQKVVVINPGCQAVESEERESVGPGAWSWSTDDLVGAKGVKTNTDEYELNLKIAKKTEKQLKDMGYKVELTRTGNDVNITNCERAMIANTMEADLYVSIYSSGEKKDEGVVVTCESRDNPYNFGGYSDCRLLADSLLGSVVEKADAANNQVVESDDVIEINWCKVPNAIVRVGNIKNPSDDEKLSNDDYQQKLANGIAAGVDSYFTQK